MTCPYSILEIPIDATPKEVKKAYYRLAMKYHPDKNPGSDGSKFKEVNEAYIKIINGDVGTDSSDSPFSKFTGIDFSQFFKNFQMDQFGGIMNDIHLFHDYYQKRKHTFGKDAKKSDTYYIHVHCNLEDIYNATVKDVDIEVDVCCRVCLGLGKKSNQTSFVLCETCNGKGLIQKTEKCSIYLDRKTQTFHGKGNNAIDLKRGDIEISILPKPHSFFYIYNDYHLACNVNTSIGETKLVINHFNKKLEFDISSLTKTIGYKTICKKNMGLYFPVGYSKKRGDLIIFLNIFETTHLQEDEDPKTYSLILE